MAIKQEKPYPISPTGKLSTLNEVDVFELPPRSAIHQKNESEKAYKKENRTSIKKQKRMMRSHMIVLKLILLLFLLLIISIPFIYYGNVFNQEQNLNNVNPLGDQIFYHNEKE